MESVNIKKLAKILNISISTVSKALRDSHDISKETKEKVIALANELNYQPNPHASSLRKAKSKTIAVIIPEIANNYFSLAINGIESIAQEKAKGRPDYALSRFGDPRRLSRRRCPLNKL